MRSSSCERTRRWTTCYHISRVGCRLRESNAFVRRSTPSSSIPLVEPTSLLRCSRQATRCRHELAKSFRDSPLGVCTEGPRQIVHTRSAYHTDHHHSQCPCADDACER